MPMTPSPRRKPALVDPGPLRLARPQARRTPERWGVPPPSSGCGFDRPRARGLGPTPSGPTPAGWGVHPWPNVAREHRADASHR